MTCSEYRDRVDELVDELLPPEEVCRYQAHAGGCAECAALEEEARRFAGFLAEEGKAALAEYEAGRLALRAAACGVGYDTADLGEAAAALVARPVPNTQGRLVVGRFGRIAAAAVLLLAAGIVVLDAFTGGGHDVLALDEPLELAVGEAGLIGGEGRLLRAETRTVSVRVREDDGRYTVDLARGDAHFRIDAGEELTVSTSQGDAVAYGAVFLVDVHGDGAVAVDVQSGRVELDGVQPLYRGDRLEIDATGDHCVLSRSRLEQMLLERDLLSRELSEIRERNDTLEDQVRAFGESAGAMGDGPHTELPLDDIGAAIWCMLDRDVPRDALEKQEAMGLLYAHLTEIRERFGVSEPFRAASSPALLSAVAPGFFRAMAPDTSDARLESVVVTARDALEDVELANADDPLPTDRAVVLQQAYLAILRAVEIELGVEVAANFVRSFPRHWSSLSTFAVPYNDRTETTVFEFWRDRFDMDPVQSTELRRLTRQYVAEALDAQRVITSMLPEDEARRVLYGWGGPGRSGLGRGPGARRSGGRADAGERSSDTGNSPNTATTEGSGASDDSGRRPSRRGPPAGWRPQEIGPSERVSAKIRSVDAMLRIAVPRVQFERAVWQLLRADQREKGVRQDFTHVLVFRPQSGE